MRQIGTGLPPRGAEATPPSPRSFDAAALTALREALPPVLNRLTDVLIPNSAFASWIEAGKSRQLRRPLTDRERFDLERRRDELAPALAPFGADETDLVAVAILDMFGGFTSMRGGEDDAAARVDSMLRLLDDQPAWAIQKACMAIRRNGVWRRDRNGEFKFDRQWPPSESELVDAVRKEAALYRDTHDRCVALLTATVEE